MGSLEVILVAIGSHGDVHPFVGIGTALRRRGHRVSVVANGYFAPLIRAAGLEPIEAGTEAEYRQILDTPDLWHRTRGTRRVFESISRLTGPVYRAIAERFAAGKTVVAHSSLALGARVAQDKLGVPTATVHLQPGVFRSAIEPARLPGMPRAKWLPRWARRGIYWAADKALIDRLLAPALNAFRAEVGLAPVQRVMEWWNSPACVIGLFPAWFATLQLDWPRQTQLTGFPLYDERGSAALPAALGEFLDAGDRPIVFTPGSAMWRADSFFAEAAAACALLGRRGLLLSRHAGHIPASLPPGVMHVPYAPFSELLPRSAALVHHGGIGTLAQAMAAGTRQLIMPFAHDQFDNADRLMRLGVARELPLKRFRAAAVSRLLGEMLASEEMTARCTAIAQRFPQPDAMDRTCALIEQLIH